MWWLVLEVEEAAAKAATIQMKNPGKGRTDGFMQNEIAGTVMVRCNAVVQSNIKTEHTVWSLGRTYRVLAATECWDTAATTTSNQIPAPHSNWLNLRFSYYIYITLNFNNNIQLGFSTIRELLLLY